MILILGNSSDSLIYLKNMLRYSEEKEELSGAFTSHLGKIYGQDVCLAETGYSSYRSELIASFLIHKYSPYIAIYIGDGVQLTPGLSAGDILMADYMQIIDVDQLHKDSSARLYEVPGFQPYLTVSDTLVKQFNDCSAHVGVINGRIGACISGNQAITSVKNLNFDVSAFEAAHHSELVFEGEVGGVGLACAFYQVPLLPIIAVSSRADKEDSALERKRIILKDAVDIGKTVVSFIVAISNDETTFIRSDEAAPNKKMKF